MKMRDKRACRPSPTVVSLLLLLISIEVVSTAAAAPFLSFFKRRRTTTTGKTSPTSNDNKPRKISPRQRRAFERDGYIVLRGVFSADEVDELTTAGHAIANRSLHNQFGTFSVVEKNLIYGANVLSGHNPNVSDTVNNATCSEEEEEATTVNVERAIQVFRNVALRSPLPQICAELLQLKNGENQCLRLLRDVFLAKYISTGDTCDWHVDDQGFWPESYLSGRAEGDPDGINVWIALDDFAPAYGGCMIVSKGSHQAPWRHEAYVAIDQNRTTDGGQFTMDERIALFTDPNFAGTCALDVSNPAIRAQAEAARVDFRLRKGDCIVATRLLFHRTSRVTQRGMQHYAGQALLNRYSLRYVPGTARLPQGQVFDLSAHYDPAYAGSTLNAISQTKQKLPWYPQVWPPPEEEDDDVDQALEQLGQNQVPQALANLQAYRAEFARRLEEVKKQKGMDETNATTTTMVRRT